MTVFIISFEPNPHIVAKFQTDRFRTFGENRGEKKKTFGRLLNHIRSAALISLTSLHATKGVQTDVSADFAQCMEQQSSLDIGALKRKFINDDIMKDDKSCKFYTG